LTCLREAVNRLINLLIASMKMLNIRAVAKTELPKAPSTSARLKPKVLALCHLIRLNLTPNKPMIMEIKLTTDMRMKSWNMLSTEQVSKTTEMNFHFISLVFSTACTFSPWKWSKVGGRFLNMQPVDTEVEPRQ
uniref:Uncharacterized protein n=1 Tax=Athene cunicularia TaxID=194338 RepID=A0A663LWM2_ATHCN